MSRHVLDGHRGPAFDLVEEECIPGKRVVIRDVGSDRRCSVTNGAEAVVHYLASNGLLGDGVTLLYYDSGGELDELEHDGVRFLGFAPGPRP